MEPTTGRAQDIEKRIQKLVRRSFWIGAGMGVLLGVTGGFIVGQASVDRITVIPLTEGIKS